jgi:DNA-binding transcriptional LysR family regulator
LIFQANAVLTRLRRPASSERIMVGFMPGLLITPAVAAFEELNPGLKVRAVRVDWSDQIESVRSGVTDIVFAREPFDPSGLDVTPLFEEPRDAVLPQGHRLAAQNSVRIAELATELLLQDPSACPEWAAHATAKLRRQAKEGATAATVEEKLERVAARRGIVILPRSTVEFYRRPDVAVIPISDIAPNRVDLIRSANHADPVIDSFITVAYQRMSGVTV